MTKKFLFLALFSFAIFSFILFSEASGAVTIPNPLGSTNTFEDLLLKIADGVGILIASLGTIMIIVSAILYLISAGNPEKMATAKKALVFAIIGIVIGISARAIVEIIENILK